MPSLGITTVKPREVSNNGVTVLCTRNIGKHCCRGLYSTKNDGGSILWKVRLPTGSLRKMFRMRCLRFSIRKCWLGMQREVIKNSSLLGWNSRVGLRCRLLKWAKQRINIGKGSMLLSAYMSKRMTQIITSLAWGLFSSSGSASWEGRNGSSWLSLL